MDMPLISIIVPVYNVERFLRCCLDSIIKQTYKNIEIILINDGSTDKSGEICDIYAQKDSRIILIHQQNKGLSAVKNIGIEKSSGDYLMFIDSDDYIAPEMCEKLLNAAIKNDSEMVLCNFTYVDEENNEIDVEGAYKEVSEAVTDGRGFLKSLCDTYNVSYVVSWNKLYKKTIFENIRYVENQLEEDEAAIHHIAHACKKIAFISESYYFYRKRSGSIMNKRHYIRRLDNTLGLLDRLDFIKKHNYSEETIYRLEFEIINDFIRSLRTLDRRNKKHRLAVKSFHKQLKPISIHLLTWKNLSKREKNILRVFKFNPLIFFYWK